MKKKLLFFGLVASLCMSFKAEAQTIPGDSIVHGPMLSPVYNNKVRVWVLTKNGTGSGSALSISLTGSDAPATPLTGTVYNQDDRLGYSLRSFEYTGLTPGASYTANVLVNGAASGRTASIVNGQSTLSDFSFLSGGCARIYDLSRCIDTPESAFHINGDPQIFNVMARENSDMMVWLGDAVYLLGLEHAMGQCPDGVDDWANKDMAFDRYLFYRQYHDQLISAMPQLAITDNHDTGPNEFNKTMPTLGQMREIFKDWWPNPEYKNTSEGPGLYSSYVYKDVEYFLLDNRSYRDGTQQHLGPEQLAWLKQTLQNSTATFKVLINGTPSFERNCGGRNFCNTAQSAELIQFIQQNNINGVISLSADIHEQKFMIREGDTKYPLYDVLSGNLNSDVGTGNGNFNINYGSDYILTGVKQTYLKVSVFGEEGDRRMKVQYVGLNGQPYFEEIIHQDMLTSQNSDALKIALGLDNAFTDASEFNHAFTTTGVAYTADRDGIANGAAQFGTTTDVHTAAVNALNFHDRPFSLVMWVNPSQIPANGATFLSNGMAGSGMSLGMDANGKLTFTNHATGTVYTSNYSVLPNAWSHIVWKYDNVRRKLSLYFNGFLIQSWASVVSPTASTADVRIGNNFQNKKFIGALDNFRLYGRIISDEEIMNDAEIESTRGGVLKMAGASNMAIPGTAINTALANDFTIEFWGKLNADPGTNYKLLASNGRVNNNSTGISFEFPDSNKLNVVVGNNTSGWNTISEQGAAWNIGEWNHVALSATKNGTMKYYVNGVLVATGNFGQYIPNSWGLGLGKSPAYSGGVNADLDELRIWKKALTQEEVASRMHYTLTGTEAELAHYYTFNSEEEATTVIDDLGSANQDVAISGALLAPATSPVSVIDTDYRDVVTGKWSRNNNINNAGLTLPDAITNYSSNVIIGKHNAEATAAVPNHEGMTYATGGWFIDPVNNPFATVRINLAQAIPNFSAISGEAGHFYLLKQDGEAEFTTVGEGAFDGQNATFYNANLAEGKYFVAWSAGEFTVGRGGAISLGGGHQVQIPYADMNATLDNSFTIETWVNLTADPANNTPIVSNHGRVNNNTTGLTIEIPDNNSVSATFGTGTGSWNSINSGASLVIGEWNHVAVTAVPGQNIKLYVNGELKATAAYTDFVPNTNWNFAIGRSINYNSQTTTIMDEFRVWKKAKTQQEIKDQMHAIINADDANLVYNFTFDQENNGTLVNHGTNTAAIAYTNAQIIDATSPVAEINTSFPDKMTGNWSVTNETTNGLYLTTDINSFTQNVVLGRNNNSNILPLGTAEDTSFVAGGWHLNAQGISTANLQVNLETVLANPAQTNATVSQYMLIKGDPASNYEVVANGTVEGLLVNFSNINLSMGNYYLAFTTDVGAVIADQGGALHLGGGHEVYVPKEGVNNALSQSFTIELWARLNATAGANTKLVGFTSLTNGNWGWEMEFLGNQTLQTITGKGAAGGWNTLNSAHTWSHGEWNHVAVTFVPNGEFKFYVNGELASSTVVTGGFQPCVNNLAFGKNIANNAPTQSDIDEFRIWTVAKSQADIRRDMYLTLPEGVTNLAYNYTFNQDNSGYLVNSGSVAVEVPYTNASIIPATDPVRNMEAAFRTNVGANWSVMNDNRNGMYLADVIASNDQNVVIGKETGSEILALPNTENADRKYLNSRWKFESLYVENGSPKADLTKIFSNLNDVNVLANEYYLIQGNPQGAYTVIATGTKQNNIVSFSQVTFNDEPVYLAWLTDTAYPIGTFPIAAQSLWKYNDHGTDLGTDWKTNTFDDSTWNFGNGILGYGDNNQSTLLSYGTDANNKYPTTYLRHTFNVENAAEYGSLLFDVLRDDGVVVYVNGVEAFRNNMPQGDVTYNTYASSQIGGADETTYVETITPNLLRNGENVIAVELHQGAANSSDLSFDMMVRALPPELAVANYPLPKDSEWHYLDNGSNLDAVQWGVSTYSPGWLSGRAPLGYGDPVNTTISYGADSSNKYITSYFYRNINVDLANVADFVEFGLKRDDGAIVYVNGVEAFRQNLPATGVNYLTPSSTTVDGADENRYYTELLPKTIFQNGVNRIAVEVHNRDHSSSDLKFDMYVKDAEDLSVACDEPHIGCFTSINPTGQTSNLIISGDHRFQMIFKEGSAYSVGTGNVPGNHDYTSYLPIEGSSEIGHLSVNHENNPGGVSMLNINLDTQDQLWDVTRSMPVDFYNNDLVTTNRNCSGGNTPWGTIITAEEATDAGDVNGDGYQDVGWLVEIEPSTGLVKEYGNGKQEKLWAMGRMNHENVVVKADGTAAYYGEDGGTHCVYKFVPTVPGNLYSGKVYVLKLDLALSSDEPSSSTATWVEVPNTTQADRNNLNTNAAALGGTNFNGVEDCDINPYNGMVYFTSKGKNRIYRFKDNGTTISDFEVFAGGMNYPIQTANGIVEEPWADGNDNLVFDNKGNLWVCQDGGKNYIWVIRPDHKQDDPKVLLFASMPAGAEPTGLTFTPDYKYGFFSVQHPNGNNAPQMDASRSQITFNASASVVFSLNQFLGIQAPVADFEANDVTVGIGESVTFTDHSTNHPTAWQWTFEGGTPATSTEEHPVVTYATAGQYDVTLVTSNVAGSSEAVTKAEYILVEDTSGTDTPIKGIVALYPNPTSGKVTIELNQAIAGEKASVEVFDLLGRKVTEINNINTMGGSQKIELDLSDFAGEQMFVIKLHVGNSTGTYKLMKVSKQ